MDPRFRYEIPILGALLGAAALIVTLVHAADCAEKVTTRRLQVVTEDGRPLIDLSLFEDSAPQLIFYGGPAHSRMAARLGNDQTASLALDCADPDLLLSDGSGSILLERDADGAWIRLVDPSNRSRIVLALDRGGDARIEIRDETGAVVWRAPPE